MGGFYEYGHTVITDKTNGIPGEAKVINPKMKYSQFASDSNVQSFINWFCISHPMLPIQLKIKSTRFVPGGMIANLTGFSTVLDNYRWESEGMKHGDWAETSLVLGSLSHTLTQAVDVGDAKAVRSSIEQILTWGGNRNKKVGAWPFIVRMSDAALVKYMRNTRQLLTLNTAKLPVTDGKKGVQKMNAMLSKVHALNAGDGLPIYDSRVAAGIACLIELWSSHVGLERNTLPASLLFQSTDARRTVNVIDETALAPRMMQRETASDQAWASCKVRLG